MINNGFYAKSETFGGNGRRTPYPDGSSENISGRVPNYDKLLRMK